MYSKVKTGEEKRQGKDSCECPKARKNVIYQVENSLFISVHPLHMPFPLPKMFFAFSLPVQAPHQIPAAPNKNS